MFFLYARCILFFSSSSSLSARCYSTKKAEDRDLLSLLSKQLRLIIFCNERCMLLSLALFLHCLCAVVRLPTARTHTGKQLTLRTHTKKNTHRVKHAGDENA